MVVTPAFFSLHKTGTSGTSGTSRMTQQANVNTINTHSSGDGYRFPRWYRPLPVQSAPTTGTETVHTLLSDGATSCQEHLSSSDAVPVLRTGKTGQCTGNEERATGT